VVFDRRFSSQEKAMKTVRELLVTLYETKAALRKLGVLRSERLTGELGEWLVETAYYGTRAKSTTQTGWDIKVSKGGQEVRIQVKAHAKGQKNGARWTDINRGSLDYFERLVIVVLSDDYFVKEWYDIPTPVLRQVLVPTKKSHVVNWESVKAYAVDWRKLPGAAGILNFEGVLKTGNPIIAG
jgi:hypothetical protein